MKYLTENNFAFIFPKKEIEIANDCQAFFSSDEDYLHNHTNEYSIISTSGMGYYCTNT